ncbi:histidine phosphatase family protein [Georgenia sp. Z1344]|uniref:histidine phosphatase family protein n=1 Tax=Georgenia sp. Z1344 TaxID=3416706 RepID=UPI003CF49128
MTARALVLLRHGQTDYNHAMRMQGQIDIPLNDTGREQAERASEVLGGTDLSRIISSDLSRAHETARILGSVAELEVTTDERFRERGFGLWEGHTHAELKEGWPEEFAVWRAGKDPDGIGVESRAAAGERVGRALLDVAEAADDEEIVAVVAHGAAITLGIAYVLGMGAHSHWLGGMGNCHWSVLGQNPGREPAWRLSVHNIGVDLVPRPHRTILDRAAESTDHGDQQVTGASGRPTQADQTGVPER